MKLSRNVILTASSILLLSSLTAKGQPILTEGNSAPLLGSGYMLQSAVFVSPPQGGPNQLWDYSQLQPIGGQYLLDYADISTSQFKDSFINCNVVERDVEGEMYYKTETTGLSILGSYKSTVTTAMINDDPRLQLKFPFTYSDNFTDSFRAHFSIGLSGVRIGSDSVFADGWGTLLLPDSVIFYNVLRVKTISNFSDDINGGVRTESYKYYFPGVKTPLLSQSESRRANISQAFYSCTYFAGFRLNVESSTSAPKFEVYPNPGKGLIRFNIPDSKGNILWSVHGVDGRFNLSGIIVPGAVQLIDCSKLPDGLYHLILTNGPQRFCTKFELSR